MESNIRLNSEDENETMLDIIFSSINLISQGKMLSNFSNTIATINEISYDIKNLLQSFLVA